MKNEREEVRLIDANKLLDKAHDIKVKQYPSGVYISIDALILPIL